MSYLIHFNKNHDKRNGRFTYGDGDGDGITDDHANRKSIASRESVKLYKDIKKKGINSRDSKNEEKYKRNPALNRAANDKKLREAFNKYRNTEDDEPDYYEDDATWNEALKMFKKDYPDWEGDPTMHKMFGYYMEDASEKSPTYQKALKNSKWKKAYEEFNSEKKRVAREFCGQYADEPVIGKYITYSDEVELYINSILYKNN